LIGGIIGEILDRRDALFVFTGCKERLSWGNYISFKFRRYVPHARISFTKHMQQWFKTLRFIIK